jgi:hypothetical protein
MDEDAPTIEKIHTHVHKHRERDKRTSSAIRRSICYKAAYSRKQALTQQNTLIKQGEATYLRIYKCKFCRYFHLTHQPPRYEQRA